MIAENLRELELVLKKLSGASKQKGLKINMNNSKVLRSTDVNQTQVIGEGSVFESGQNYLPIR